MIPLDRAHQLKVKGSTCAYNGFALNYFCFPCKFCIGVRDEGFLCVMNHKTKKLLRMKENELDNWWTSLDHEAKELVFAKCYPI